MADCLRMIISKAMTIKKKKLGWTVVVTGWLPANPSSSSYASPRADKGEITTILGQRSSPRI